jgi:hypothetical protein
MSLLEQIRIIEPEAKSYTTGVSNYIVALSNGNKVCINKQSVEGMLRECLICRQQIRLYRTEEGWEKRNLDNTEHIDRKYRRVRVQ